MAVTLRPYQETVVQALRGAYAAGRRAPIAVMPTGAGKTVVFSAVAESGSSRGKRILILAHRRELIKQASRKLMDAGVQHGIISPGFTASRDHIQVGSVQTVARRLDDLPKFDLLIIDECFPAGTLIDGRPIEEIAPGAMVRTFDDRTGEITVRPVVRCFRKYASKILELRFFSGRRVACTPNHPFLTPEGWKNAEELSEGSHVFVDPMHRVPIANRDQELQCSRSLDAGAEDLLLFPMPGRLGQQEQFVSDGEDQSKVCIRQDARTQSNGSARHQGEDAEDVIGDWASAETEGRQWQAYGHSSAGSLSGPGRPVDQRTGGPGGNGVRVRMANPLQDRHGASGGYVRGGSGRWKPRDNRAPPAGREEGWLSDFDRVDSVEVHERSSYGRFAELCPGGVVYNFEVEGTHTYFAGGLAVHNCHHSIAGQYKKIIEAQPQARLLGVTATPERLDGRGLGVTAGGCFDEMVVGPSVSELIDGGFLTPARIFAPADAPDLSGIRTKMGDYETAGLLAKIDVPTLTGDVVAHYAEHAPGLPAIAFCITVDHARHVAATFQAAGWRAVAAHGGMTTPERDAAIGGLATGKVQVLCTCDLVSEGLDVPAVGAVILLRPTKSLGLFLQQVGRGLRPAPGKQHLIVLDHAGCTMQHGLPDSPRQWSLAGRPKKEKAPAIRQCKECWALHSPAPSCPSCGFVYPKPKGGEGRSIAQKEGVLAEITGDKLNLLRNAPLRDLLKKAKTRDDLVAIQRAKGYAKGWVWHVENERRQRRTVAA